MVIGETVGSYTVLAKLGEGGMGEVYRARDLKLKREVALKVLPTEVANDRERLSRFQREAEVLASLNHPNIAQIYGIEEGLALVLELVEGEDLAERLKRGPIPLDEALPVAKQIAEALEAAHEQGVIHRDLKPANIKVRPDGTVKVLDFGLAKALDPTAGIRDPGSPHLANSPTITSPDLTLRGVILGTAAYMAPEQAKGKVVDKRADIWAFGVVLYEMLTGTRAFKGEDITDTIVAVVSKQPDWSRLPVGTPATLRRVLRKCLEKDVRQRLRDIGDAHLGLGEPAADEPEAIVPTVSRRDRVRTLAPWAVSAILAIALLASWALLRPASAPPASRYPIALAEGERVGPTSWAPMAVSPDGSRLAYVGESGRLMVRSRDQIGSVELAGTDGAFNPFFSPDGTRVGFMSGQAGSAQLRAAPLAGGPPAIITADTVGGPGASWGTDGYIYYDSSGVGPLRRVRENGGDSEVVSTLDSAAGELQHDWPDALPSGRGVLITINRGGPGVNVSQSDDVGVVDLATGRHRVLVHGVLARYAASGHIVYVTAEGVLMAAPFDEDRLEVTGNSIALIEGINLRIESGGIDVALSRSGTLWYATGTQQGRQEVLWATPTGEFSTVEAGWTGAFEGLALSPDGTKLALTITDSVGQQIWMKDLSRPKGPLSKVTHERVNSMPRWHPDGTRITFVSALAGRGELRSARVDGTGDQSVLADDLYVMDGGWTRDGRWLVYSGQGPAARVFREDVHGLRPGTDAKPVPLAATPYNERRPSVSPDGRWMAFEANPTGRYEIYVRPFPDTSASQSPVSTGGGSRPKWSRDGREIFYENGANELTRVAMVPGRSFLVERPRTLFSLAGVRAWDVAADGRVIVIRAAEGARGGQLVVVEDFFEELRRKVPR